MYKSIGIDLIEIDRMEKALERRPSLCRRLFSQGEIDYCLRRGRPGASFAARFAAKEAVRKACSAAGVGAMPWREIEILLTEGKPVVYLSGLAASLAVELGIDSLLVSLSHSRYYACAVVLAEGSRETVGN
jgi:holo-[acyl-carrier protein] synthase